MAKIALIESKPSRTDFVGRFDNALEFERKNQNELGKVILAAYAYGMTPKQIRDAITSNRAYESKLNDDTVTTHMGDQIIQRENKTDDLLTKEKAQQLEKVKKEEDKKEKKVVKRNKPSKRNEKQKSKSGLSNLKNQ